MGRHERLGDKPMGYFKDVYELSEPVRSDGDFEHFFFGFMIVMAPVGVPLYWIGRIGAKIYQPK